MSGELEAAGALATAGLVAGAIEGKESGAAAEGACANCGTPISGHFCSNCGQAAVPTRSLLHVCEEFLHGLLHFDTKAWRTLPMVIFRPGTLTRNFVYGKRARYISPLATFLLCIFLMFFAFSFIEAPVDMAGTPIQQRAQAVTNLAEARTELAEAERELEAERVAPPPTDGTPPGLDLRLAEQAVRLAREEVERREASVRRIDRVIAERAAREEGGPIVTINAAPTPTEAPAPQATPAPEQSAAPAEAAEGEAAARADDEEEIDGLGWGDGETWQDGVRRLADSENFVVFNGASPELTERVRNKLRNPDLALYSILDAASKFSFLLVPLSLPFIAFLFLWKKGVTLYDHVVYALYALSFASLLFVTVIFTAQSEWTNWASGWLLTVGLPVHTFFHLGGAYALKWWSAFWRTLFMLTFATIIASVFVVLVVLLGLTG